MVSANLTCLVWRFFSEFSASILARISRLFSGDRKSTRLNSSHSQISYAVFCLKKTHRGGPGREAGRAVNVTALADELLDVIAEEDPLNDALEGYPAFGGRLPDVSEAGQRDLRDRALAIAEAAEALEPAAGDRVTRAVVVQQAGAVVDRVDARLVEHTLVDYGTAPIGRLLGALPLVRPAGGEQERAFLA